MKYWDDMTEKYGFNDGASAPADARFARDVYCKVVNALAERKGSNWRVVPFNRPGMHNSCMIIQVSATWFNEVFLPQQTWDRPWEADESIEIGAPVAGHDDQLQEAVRAASDMDLDDLIEVEVRINSQGFDELLERIDRGETVEAGSL